MVYRFSWLAGAAAVLFALSGLTGLLRPTTDGTRWQFIVIAALILGATITWTALTYRAHPIFVVFLNLVALTIAIARIAAPETMNGLLPTAETWSAVTEQLDRAIALIRTGIEPVTAPTPIWDLCLHSQRVGSCRGAKGVLTLQTRRDPVSGRRRFLAAARSDGTLESSPR